MIRTSPQIALLMAIVLTIAPASSTVSLAQGKTCAQIVNEYNTATNELKGDLEQSNVGFLHNELFKDDDFMQKWDEIKSVQEDLNNIYLCLRSSSPCLKSIGEKLVNSYIKDWLDGLTESTGLNAVRDRVASVQETLNRYTERVLKISVDTMKSMQECTAPMRGQPRVDANAVPPAEQVNADGTPVIAEPPSKPVDDGGGIGGTLGLVAAIGGGAYLASELGLFGGQCAAEAPNNYHATCENQGRSSANCIALQTEYQAWCDCQGRNFSYTGGCTGGR